MKYSLIQFGSVITVLQKRTKPNKLVWSGLDPFSWKYN